MQSRCDDNHGNYHRLALWYLPRSFKKKSQLGVMVYMFGKKKNNVYVYVSFHGIISNSFETFHQKADNRHDVFWGLRGTRSGRISHLGTLDICSFMAGPQWWQTERKTNIATISATSLAKWLRNDFPMACTQEEGLRDKINIPRHGFDQHHTLAISTQSAELI